MNKEFDIDQLIKQGKIKSELELERASLAERKLRLISKEVPESKIKRRKLRELILAFEEENWNDRDQISDTQIKESDNAEKTVLNESKFIETRKELIKNKLKTLGLNQQEFGIILGHNSKSYISELMNGIVPFSLKDLIVISKLLKIDLNKLILTHISDEDKTKIENTIKKLEKHSLKLDKKEFALEM